MSSLIVLVIFYFVAMVVKNTMKQAAESFNANMPGQMPPPAPQEEEQVEESCDDDASIDIATLLQTLSQKNTVESQPSVAMSASADKRVVKPVTQKIESDNEEINLHTADEARRAFIYSEIFNRKYE